MKILFLNASPRVNGNISKMIHLIAQQCEAAGAEVELIRVQDLKVHPCMACMKCRSALQCVLPPDDAQRILALIQQADALVLGAPCYWGNMPGTLKLLFDRIVYGMMGENSLAVPKPLHKGKRFAIVTASSTMWPFNIIANQTRGVVRALNEILGWSGFKCVTTIQKAGTFRHPEFNERDRKKCLRAARKLLK